jgi:hypothetical protein
MPDGRVGYPAAAENREAAAHADTVRTPDEAGHERRAEEADHELTFTVGGP